MDWQRRRIKSARIERGMSAEQVVAKCSWGITTQRKIESGAKSATDGELFELARALDVDVGYLLHESADPFPPIKELEQAPAASEPDARNGRGTAASEGSGRRLRTSVRSELKERPSQADGDPQRKSG